jgi:hypothetical protein
MSIDIVSRAILLGLASALLFSSCANKDKARTPNVYRGGQYYEDAIHR